MTNTDERVHYGFHYSDAVRARALSLDLIELDGKLIKVLRIFTAESAKRGGEESAINARSQSARVPFPRKHPSAINASRGNRLNKLRRFFIFVWQ